MKSFMNSELHKYVYRKILNSLKGNVVNSLNSKLL